MEKNQTHRIGIDMENVNALEETMVEGLMLANDLTTNHWTLREIIVGQTQLLIEYNKYYENSEDTFKAYQSLVENLFTVIGEK